MVGIVTKICLDDDPAWGVIRASNGQDYFGISTDYTGDRSVLDYAQDLLDADVTFDPGPNRVNGESHHGAHNIHLTNEAEQVAYVAAMAARRLGDETLMTAFHALYGPIECTP